MRDICFPILTKFVVFRQIFVEVPVSNFMKIRPVGAALIHVKKRTDRRKNMGNIVLSVTLRAHPKMNIKAENMGWNTFHYFYAT
jgi:hypothetical protein